MTKLGRADEMDGVIVQHMVDEGLEIIAGVTQDPAIGPLIMFGSGGIYAELIKDITLRLHPLTDTDAREMVRSVKLVKLFEGFWGAPPSDTAAAEDLLLRLSAMVEDLPKIEEIDFNPVKLLARGQGDKIINARIRLRSAG